MKIHFNLFYEIVDITNNLFYLNFIKILQNVFNTNFEFGTIDNSDILFESNFGNNTLLYKKKWMYSFLHIGESDRRLSIFMNYGLLNPIIKDYSCVLRGKSGNEPTAENVINFPLFLVYSYCYDFIYKFKTHNYDTNRFNKIQTKTFTNIPKNNVCVIISNTNDQEGRNLFIEELNKKVHIDYAGNYKNNVKRLECHHCTHEFIDFVSKYKVIITMENSKILII